MPDWQSDVNRGIREQRMKQDDTTKLWRMVCVINGAMFVDVFSSMNAAKKWGDDLVAVYGWDYARGDRQAITREA